MSEPITREEMYLAALGGEAATLPDPLTREELYLAYLNGMTDTYPEPITRTEQYLYKLCQNGMGSGGGVTIRNQNKTITQNGQYKADSGYTGLGTVTVNVPQEDPVLQDKTVTENGTVTADAGFDGLGVVTVNVEASGGGGSGGGDDIARAIVERTITEYVNNEIEVVGDYSFCRCAALVSVTMQKVSEIRAGGFEDCISLKDVNMPNLDKIGNSGFQNCSSLEHVKNIDIGKLGQRAFYACTTLKYADKLSGSAFSGRDSFSNCTSLERMELLELSKWGLGMVNCTALRIIAIRTNTLCSLTYTTELQNTAFKQDGAGGVLLIPSALVESYKTATNWSVIYGYGTNRFLALEDFTIDGTTKGEIDWDKVNALFE